MSLLQTNNPTQTTAIMLPTPAKRLPDDKATITPRGNPKTAHIPHVQFKKGLFKPTSFFSLECKIR
jgi:hypothetical protein